MYKTYLEKILFKLLCLVPLIVLIVVHSMLFPYITGKNFIFRILIEIIFGLWLILIFVDPQYRPKNSVSLYSFLVFLIILGTADLLGENPTLSFWSNYSRMEGWITHAHLFLYYLVAVSFLKTKAQWLRIFKLSFLVSACMTVYAFAQTQDWIDVVNKARVDGTLGNSAYLAIYVTSHLFIGLYLIFHEKRPRRNLLYALICGAQFFTLFLTQTRGTFLALIAGLSVLVFYFCLTRVDRSSAKKILRAIAICLLSGGILMTGFWIGASPKSQAGERLVTTNVIAGQSVQTRLMLWKAAWQAIQARPLLGWGQENFNYAAAYFPPAMWNEPWPDRAHNLFLDWLLAAGLLGCLAYLSIYASTAVRLWRETDFHPHEKVLLLALFICFFINNIFIFDQIISYIIFFSFVAFIASRNQRSGQWPLQKKSPWAVGFFSFFMAIVIAFAIYEINYKNIRANLTLIKFLQPRTMFQVNEQGKPELAIESILNENLLGTSEVRDHLATTALMMAEQKTSPEVKSYIFDFAKRELDKEITTHPHSAYLRLLMGRLLGAYGYVENADQLFRQAEALAPTNQDILVEHAENYLRAMQFNKVSELDFKVFSLENPPSEKAQMFNAVGLIYGDHWSEAFAQIEKLKKANSPFAFDAHIINALRNRQRPKEAEELIEFKNRNEIK